MRERVALLSVQPRFAEALLAGTKTVEVRRRAPRFAPGSLCLIYASSPVRALLGAVTVESVNVGPATDLWPRWGSQTALDEDEFDQYLAGASQPCVIAVRFAIRFDVPISLADLRSRFPAFVVPQSYRFVRAGELAAVTTDQIAKLRTVAGHPGLDGYGAGQSEPQFA